jgi:hypothetical protein
MRLGLQLVAVTLLGCREADAPVPPVDETQLKAQITALAASYRPLDPAVARITNLSPVTIYEHRCAGKIVGFGEWGGACWSLSDRIPGPNYRPIPSGSSVEDTLYINALASAGQWRFQFDLRDAEGDLLPLAERVSPPFVVVPRRTLYPCAV